MTVHTSAMELESTDNQQIDTMYTETINNALTNLQMKYTYL